MYFHIVDAKLPSGNIETWIYWDRAETPDNFCERWESCLNRDTIRPASIDRLQSVHLENITDFPFDWALLNNYHVTSHYYRDCKTRTWVSSLDELLEGPKETAPPPSIIKAGQQWSHGHPGQIIVLTVISVYTNKKGKTKIWYTTPNGNRQKMGYHAFVRLLAAVKATLVPPKDEKTSFNFMDGQVYRSEGHPDIVITYNQVEFFARHYPPEVGGLLWDCVSYKSLVEHLTEKGYTLDGGS